MIIFTEEQAQAILKSRGIVVENRNAVRYDGEQPFTFKRLEVWNPLKEIWKPLSEIFPDILNKAATGIVVEQINKMDTNEIFS